MAADADWTGSWVASRLTTHEEVAAARTRTPRIVEVTRKRHPLVLVGTLSAQRVDAAMVNEAFNDCAQLSFLVNIPKESYITGEAIEITNGRGVPIGGLADLYRALSEANILSYRNPEVVFLDRGLTQHHRIVSHRRLDDRRYLIARRNLPDVLCVVVNEYELTADHVRTTYSRYGGTRYLVLSNPNGNPTSSALEVAKLLGYEVLKWGPFLGALHKP